MIYVVVLKRIVLGLFIYRVDVVMFLALRSFAKIFEDTSNDLMFD